MPLVIFKNEPFTQVQINSVINAAKAQDREKLHYTGYETEPYKSLASGTMRYKQLISSIDFNSKPTSDNNPFFYNYSKFIPGEMLFVHCF